MRTAALLLVLALLPAEARAQVEVITGVAVRPDALPRLRPLLAWAGRALPDLRPEGVEAALGPLALHPFDPAGWGAAGLDPRGAVWLAPGRLGLPVGDGPKLEAHLLRAGVATATVAGGLGLAAGRPSVVGALLPGRLWLAPYRSLMAEPPERLRRLARRRGADVASTMARHRPPQTARPRAPGLPKRAPDAVAAGTGPAPVAGWTGRLWAEPDQTVGWAHLDFAPGARSRAQPAGAGRSAPGPQDLDARGSLWLGQLGEHGPPPLLAASPAVVLEAWATVDPGALALGFSGLRAADGRLLSGAVHAALTEGGTLAVAVALRPGAAPAAVRAAVARLEAAQPGAVVAIRADPARVVAAFPGADEPTSWLAAAPGAGRRDAPAGAWLRPPALLEALAQRDAQPTGPRLGAGRRVALRLAYGALLAAPGDLAVALWRRPGGAELVLTRRAQSGVDAAPRPHQ